MREENRELWRDTQRQLNELAGRVDSIAARLETFVEEAAVRDRETDRRFRETDARIDKLVVAIGESSAPASRKRPDRFWDFPRHGA